MTLPEELESGTENKEISFSGESNAEIEAFVRESQNIIDRLVADNNELRNELKSEKALRLQASSKIVEQSATLFEEASEIAAGYISTAKEKAANLTEEANDYHAKVTKEADDYRASIVNEVETERDLIALEVEELKESHKEMKARLVAFHQSYLDQLTSEETEDSEEEKEEVSTEDEGN